MSDATRPRLELVKGGGAAAQEAETAQGAGGAPSDSALADGARADNALADGAAESGGRRAAESRAQQARIVEALLFAAQAPLAEAELAEALPEGADVAGILEELQAHYAQRGVKLVKVAGKWQLRTAEDLRWLLRKEKREERKLGKAALETLAIIAYHQPVTRAEIEDIRGVATSKGTLDTLMELGWVRIRGRRRVPGRPVTFGVTDAFLEHFGLESVNDLPGLRELKAAGLLNADIPPDLDLPARADNSALTDEEDPFEPQEEEEEPPLEMHLPEEDETAEEAHGAEMAHGAEETWPGGDGGDGNSGGDGGAGGRE